MHRRSESSGSCAPDGWTWPRGWRNCPEHGVEGGKNRIHVIDQELCIKCGTCYEACPEKLGAIRALVGEPVPPPIPEEERTIERSGKRAE